MSYILIVVTFTCFYVLVKIHRPIHLKRVNFTICKIFLEALSSRYHNKPDCKQKRAGGTNSGMSGVFQMGEGASAKGPLGMGEGELGKSKGA